MEAFDFDRHFRRMELANGDEFTALEQELNEYLLGPEGEQEERKVAWKQALARLKERSAAELTLAKELIGRPEAV